MNLFIPIWLLWVGGILGGIVVLWFLFLFVVFAVLGWKMRNFRPFW